MKKFLFVVVVLIALGVTLMLTCPDKKAHQEAIKAVASEVVNAEMDSQSIDESLASIGTVLALGVVDAYLSTGLIVRDHTFYNVGVISYEGEFRIVSVGVLNHVFTIDKENARKLMKDKLALPVK